MDVVAHVLWTNVVFYSKYARQRRQRYWAAFFGVLPDLIAFTPVVVYLIWERLLGNISLNNYLAAYSHPSGVYAYATNAYNYSHSLVIWLLIFIVVFAIRRGKVYWPLLGWALHIVIDIFTHPDFFRTPFLFPLSGWKNSHAIAWSDPKFMAVNYSLLAIVYIILWQYNKRHQSPSIPPHAQV